jgi:hypothetical protein
MQILKRRTIHAGRLERWLGEEKIADVQRHMQGWYGPPIYLRDVPGSVFVTPDGDFSGSFERGFFASAHDALAEHLDQFLKRLKENLPVPELALNAGFASLGDALSRASQGDGQNLNGGQIVKNGPTGVANVASTLWRVGSSPQAGVAPSAAPAGNAPTKATVGAMPFVNPSTGTLHLTGADMAASVINNCLLLYDRIFHVAKTMNSAGAEAVTGVPTRYQNTVAGAPDYIGGNFLFVEVGGTALPATAHNWTVCTYRDQTDVASTLPSLTGNASAIVDRLDHPAHSWFAPLEAGDQGIKALTQMQCSAAVATGLINFVIGHPLAFMLFPIIPVPNPFDWLTERNPAPRVFDDACLALLELPKPSSGAAIYSGMIYATRAAP